MPKKMFTKAVTVCFAICCILSILQPSELQEIKRFASLKNFHANINGNVSVYFRSVEKGDESEPVQIDTVQLRFSEPKAAKLEEFQPAVINEETVGQLIDLAKKLNLSVAITKQVYKQNQNLSSYEFYSEEAKMTSSDGRTRIVIQGDEEEMSKDNDVESFLEVISDYEINSETRKIEYNQAGDLTSDKYITSGARRVKILSSAGLSATIQLHIAEVLKRTFGIKKEPEDRIDLLKKLLRYTDYNHLWHGGLGDGIVPAKNKGWIKVEFEGEGYVFWRTKVPK